VRVLKEMETQAAEAGEDVKLNMSSIVKPLHKIIAENKDVAKLVMQLNSTVIVHRNDVNDLFAVFSVYDELWKTVNYDATVFQLPVVLCRLHRPQDSVSVHGNWEL